MVGVIAECIDLITFKWNVRFVRPVGTVRDVRPVVRVEYRIFVCQFSGVVDVFHRYIL